MSAFCLAGQRLEYRAIQSGFTVNIIGNNLLTHNGLRHPRINRNINLQFLANIQAIN